MFQYIIALFLISTYSYSLGGPVQKSVLEKQLLTLANNCENTFITSQIQSKLPECSLITQPFNEKQIQCLLFYDINKRLCDAISASKVSLPDDYSGLFNEVIDVEDTCEHASNWNFTDLAEIPAYKETMLHFFHVKVSCLRVCSVPDLSSPDTNFFCKYFEWGSEKLNSSMPKMYTDAKIQLSNEKTTSSGQIINNNVNVTDAVNNNLSISSSPVAVIDSTSVVTSKPLIGSKSSGLAVTQLEETKVDLPAPDNALPQEKVGEKEKNGDGHGLSHLSTNPKSKTNNHEGSLLRPEVTEPNALDKPSAAGMETPNKEDEDIANKIDKTLQVKLKETTNNKIKSVDRPESDYNDSEEGKEGLIDGDDNDNGEDPGVASDLEPKPQSITQPQNTKRVENTMSFGGGRDYYPMQVEPYADDDDHFFPLFLTGVILVVLLYVLYHNMSKVSRVVLGLIVEGRQPGRRRNSRGHAYRRLDTLEQAMSTNSAAPPSKIIY